MLALATAPVLAQEATGGAGDTGSVGNGGNGGDAGAVGSNGTGRGPGNGGSAGTAVAPDGGAGGNSFTGGSGGGGGGFSFTFTGNITTPSQGGNGGDGGNGSGGGGGGGDGARIAAPSAATVSATVTGGTGGSGGIGGDGGGGGGGAGVDMQTASGLTVNAAVTGGSGGGVVSAFGGSGGGGAGVILELGGGLTVNAAVTGGAGGFFTQTSPLGGGSGGDGVVANAAANVAVSAAGTITGGKGFADGTGGVGLALSAGGTVINAGTITGGVGGGDQTGGSPGTAGGTGSGGAPGSIPNTPLRGVSGAGITGANLTVINSGTIAGGNNGLGQANAITLTGGSNILELWSGSSISGNVVGTGSDALRFGGSTNASFNLSNIGSAAQYQGFSTFIKTGTSTWITTGSTSATGAWSINQGTLEVDGAIGNASSVTVNSGGTLSGTGTIGDPAIALGGTLSPGSVTNPYGTLTLTDALTFASGSFYTVHISPSTNSFTQVNSTATLGGATVNAIFASGSYVAKQYTILTATGGVSGTFASTVVNTNLPFAFKTSLSYDASDVYLKLGLAFTGLPNNQQVVGNTLVNYFNATGGIPIAFGALTPGGLTQVSGETATGSQQTTFDAMGQFMGLMTDPFMGGRGGINGAASAPGYADEEGASAYAAQKRLGDERNAYAMFTKAPLANVYEPRWSVWASGFGGSQSTDGNAALGSNDTTSRIAGTAVGADYLFSPNTLAGFALAGGGTSFSVNNLGSGRSDLFQAGAYVRHTEGNAYVTGALAYGWQDITTDRTVTAAGLDHLRAEFNANAYSGRIEGGYRYVAPLVGGIGITPYAAGQFTTFDLPAYAEQAIVGSNAFALAYNAKDVTDTRSELGIRTDKSWAMIDGILTLRGRVAWAHDYDPDRSIGATFQTLPGASFVVNGAAQASDSALVTASVEKKWLNGWSAAATFEGEFSNVTSSYAGKGVVRYKW
jgi:uncharacterized protein with beta-barrel porin domain